MQEQINKNQEQEKKGSVLDFLKADLENARKSTRTVTLKYKSCCGCGCSEVDIERVVDFYSSLKDGDYVNEVLDTDRVI